LTQQNCLHIHFSDKAGSRIQQVYLLAKAMILLVLVLASNFVFTWVIPIACVCACVASENQALNFDLLFSNLLIIYQVKTKKITTVKEVWIPGLN